MGMTIAEKILARASGQDHVNVGDIVTVKVDTAIVIDMGFFPGMWRWPTKVHNPDNIIVLHDHIVPPKDTQSAEALVAGRKFVKDYKIERFQDSGAHQGLAHQLAADRAYALPGTVLVCVDSHTCSGGAINCCARGIGSAELTYVLCKGETWFKVGPSIRYELTGSLPNKVSAKDVFLYISGLYGSHANMNIEFGGPSAKQFSINARRTLSTMSAELSAEFALWEPDEVLMNFLKERTNEVGHPTFPDKDAQYLDIRTIDLNALEPYVALPDSVVNNTTKVRELKEKVKVDQCFVGSCANGTIEDLEAVDVILKGKKISDNVRFIITPGSQDIMLEAAKKGIVTRLLEAGVLFTPSTCGACAGVDLGALGKGETCITASTRNFKGRMGSPQSRIFMGSPATVAASAITGYITDPRDL